MAQSSKNEYANLRTFGGLSLEYSALTEVDFTAAAGSAYSPPESGGYRRNNVSRCIQLLSDATGVIETFQTSAAELRLPANTITVGTNDAGNGRLFFLKNSGTGAITVKDYLGTTLWTVLQSGITIVVGNDNNNWDFYFKAINIPHDAIASLETSSNVQSALAYFMELFRDVLWEPTGLVNKYKDSVLSFNDSIRTVTIAPRTPTYTSYRYYIRGKVYEVSSPLSVVTDDLEGLWYIYFKQDGTLFTTQTPWSILDPYAFVSNVYWDSTNKKYIRKNEERHGCRMDGDTHRRMHLVDGSQIQTTVPLGLQIVNYIENGDGSLNTHAQYGVTNGVFFDEDIDISITHSATPVNEYEQVLQAPAKLPVFYLLSTDNWRKKDATVYPFYENPPSLPYYNSLSAGSWSLQPVTDGYFFATWHCYSDDIYEPVCVILGQRQDTNLIDAVNNNNLTGIPSLGILGLQRPRKFTEEVVIWKKIIWQVSTSYTNTPKCRLRYIAFQTEVNAANDRYAVICNYNGNAGTGKYLEFYAGQSSDLSPFPIPEPSFLKTITLTAVASSTGTVAIYKSTDLVNPITSISLSAAIYIKVSLAIPINTDDKLVAKVSSGSINKPAVTLFIQTNL